MAYKILEKNGVDNENIDGAAFNNFSAGGRDGIVAGVLSECSLSLSGNVIGIAPGELILHGFRVKITETETFSNSSVPVSAEKYQIIAQIVVSDNNDVVFSFLIRSPATLIQENIFDNNRGTYQIEIGTYMHNPDGSISELTRTVQVFYADIHKSAEEAKAASKEAAASAAAAQNAAKDAAQAASTAIADYITHTKNGAAVGEVDTLAGAKAEVEVGSKNLFNWKLAGKSENGITYTQNSDGSITVNGTATDRSYAYIIGYDIPINPGIYTFSGCPSGGQSTTYRLALSLYIDGVWQTNETDYGDSVTFEVALPINQMTAYIEIMSGTTVENLTFYPQLEYGETATPYTPYLSEGAAVEVQACGENLANENTLITSNEYERTYFQGRECLKFKGTEFKGITLNFPESLNVVGVNWALDSDTPNKEISFISLKRTTFSNEIITTYVGQGDVEINNWVDAAKTASPTLFDNIKSLIITGTGNLGTGTFYVQIMANLGDELTPYTPYTGAAYQSEVGQTIEVEQYDRVTNIFSNSTGASLAVQFKISTQLYLDRFGLIEEGAFANRPTDISEQSRVYIATDKFDNSRYTYLKGEVDGSVTENWTEIVNYGQDNLQTKAKELVPAINEVNAAAGIALLNIPKSAEETGAFISGDNTLAGAKAEVSIESKNLIPFPYASGGAGSTVTKNGVTFTVNADQSVTVNGTTSSGTGFDFIYQGTLKKAGYYTISTKYNLPEGLLVVIRKNGMMWMDASSSNPFVTGYYNIGDTGVQCSIWVPGGSTVTNAIVYPQLEYGETATAYTPYLPTGTAVEVQACGKNLLNPATFQNGQEYIGVTLTNNQDGTITLNGTSAATSYFSIFSTNADAHTPIPEYLKGKRITLSLETNGNDLNDCTLVTWAGEINNFVDDFSETKILSTTIQPDVTDWSIRIKLKSGQTYNNILYKIMVTFGEYAGSLYIPYEGMTYPAAVGETIEVEQYDRVTNIFSNTTGAAVSTQFLQSTRYELDTKPVSLAGTYAERPTGTYPYVVLYTATDTGRTYRLERDTNGSVSSNWVNISSAGGTGGGFTPRGEWNSTTTYNENDLVSLNGSSYICIEENTNATPASNPDKWMVNAEKGATGATGTTGSAGTDGHSVYTSTDVCSANVGETCGAYKDTTSAKGIGDVIITANGKVFTVERETVISERGVWEGICTAIIIGPQGPQGEWGNGWYRVDTEISSSVVNVDRSKLYPAEPAIVREGETVVYADGHIGKINSQTGTTVRISVYSISLQGPQGPAGANGTNGKDYLIYKGDTFTGTSTPERFATTVSNDDFNRAPVTGEYFNALYKETSSTYGDKLSYCIFEVALAAESGTLVSVFKTERIDTKKYLHRVSVNLGEGLCWFQFVNNVSTNYTDEDVVDAIYRYGAQADVVAIQASGYFSEKIVVGVYAPTASNQIYIWLSSGEASNIVVGTGSVTDQVVEL